MNIHYESRIAELLELIRIADIGANARTERIAAQAAQIERLREALEWIVENGCSCSECYCCGPTAVEYAEKALTRE